MSNEIHDQLLALGFATELAGGGCEMLSRYFESGSHIWITGADGPGLPTADDWLVCVYAPIGEGFTDTSPPLWQKSSDEGDPTEAAGRWKDAVYAAIDCAAAVDQLRRIDISGALAAPPLSVEVSAIKRSEDGSGWTTTDDAHADGYGVYIRNIYAQHVSDFLIPDWQAPTDAARAAAKRAAYVYADALAAHLGCGAVGGERSPEPVTMVDLLHGAACLWEEALKINGAFASPTYGAGKDAPRAVREFLCEWEDHGTVHMRVMVTGWAEECERDWKRAHDAGEFDDAFDWEWVPAWLGRKLEACYPAPVAPPAPVDLNGRRMIVGDLYAGAPEWAHTAPIVADPAQGGAS